MADPISGRGRLKAWFEKNSAPAFTGQLLFEEPLSKHSYYRIGGPAEMVAIPKSVVDLEILARAARECASSVFFLGLGSNCLFADDGFSGIVVKTGRLNLEIERTSETSIRTGVSVAISSLLRRCAADGWAGLEFLTGIPGSVGGVVRMNGGTHLGESSDRLTRIDFFRFSKSAIESQYKDQGEPRLDFEYRKNRSLPPDALVYSADWKIESGDPAAIKKLIDETLTRRKATQPLDAPSCGSVFKNPRAAGLQAWQVVDRLGLRGHQIGGAQVAEQHSNWILNRGNARADDVRALIELIQKRARLELGVELEAEVVLPEKVAYSFR